MNFKPRKAAVVWLLALTPLLACQGSPEREVSIDRSGSGVERPALLLITLDTTRADHLGVERGGAATPNLDALASRGLYFTQAYSTVPTTLPAHASMMTGLYPFEHGVRENARYLPASQPLAAERLQELGYQTAAFVSGFPLAGQFGLARGFDRYDDDFLPSAERRAEETAERALEWLAGNRTQDPAFLWVHFYDPHEPYDPPEPFRSRYPGDPYQGEIAYMDAQVGRLIDAFEARFGEHDHKILVVADHGEGLGDHGEQLHGNLLYQETMRVPLIVAGSGIEPGRRETVVSSRQVLDTLLDWAGDAREGSLVDAPQSPEPVLGEAMKPFLQYGWQPQVMAVHDGLKVIRSGSLEVYDLAADPAERNDLAATLTLDRDLRQALRAYPFVPEPTAPAAEAALSQEDRQRLASLGYVGWDGASTLRDGAPSPREMTHLFAALDHGSGLFVRERYRESVKVFDGVLAQDPNNLMVALRLAVAHSVLGEERQALTYFERARRIEPSSIDVRHYLAMHHCRRQEWAQAEPLVASVLAQEPSRLAAIECLAQVRRAQGRLPEAAAILERAIAQQEEPAESLAALGQLRMMMQDTPGATRAFERALALQGDEFRNHLDLGVLYLAARQLDRARVQLDQVPSAHPGYPMALFKRAQVSVLLNEPDRQQRVRLAYQHADHELRQMIENEALFRGLPFR